MGRWLGNGAKISHRTLDADTTAINKLHTTASRRPAGRPGGFQNPAGREWFSRACVRRNSLHAVAKISRSLQKHTLTGLRLGRAQKITLRLEELGLGRREGAVFQ
jgi:hypothetical protein